MIVQYRLIYSKVLRPMNNPETCCMFPLLFYCCGPPFRCSGHKRYKLQCQHGTYLDFNCVFEVNANRKRQYSRGTQLTDL